MREVAPGLRERVAHPRRAPLVGLGHDQAEPLQRPQPGGQDRRSDPVDVGRQLPERAICIEQRADDAQRPAVADAARGRVERAVVDGHDLSL